MHRLILVAKACWSPLCSPMFMSARDFTCESRLPTLHIFSIS